ncbi:MAG: prolipoprotein diacylglyceryl transferase [Hirschia sp.]|nr:prolipoprotein diacylglyceryl transferase [Hirschia sp.]MBF19123.1 prolipoprotein diacylglyceryl transferase [Hirschia sp.]
MFAAIPFPEINPAVFTIPGFSLGDMNLGPFPLRWYALAYIVGLLLAWRYANLIVQRSSLWRKENGAPMTKDDIDDFAFWAMVGVMAGGRFGYILFYQLPFNPGRLIEDPLFIFKTWEGGMSFHGGLIGVALAMIFVARARKIPLLSLADVTAAATPIGLLLGRFANFINGELYGRPTDAPWAIRFPEWTGKQWVYENQFGQAVGSKVPVHPSQLYEAALEGMLLLVILAIAVWSFKALKRPGLVTGLFLIGYGSARTFIENFRKPDTGIDFIFGDFLTMGMLLSAPMYICGAWLIMRALRKDSNTVATA